MTKEHDQSEDMVLTNSAATKQLHSDPLGEWFVIDDGPEHDEVFAIPASWEHRQLLSRQEASERFAAIDSVPTELNAMRLALEALEVLDETSRARAIRWLADRLAGLPPTASQLPSVPAREAGRREWLQRAWLVGLPVEDIADRMGLTVTTVNSKVYRMRRDGWELPRRKRRPQ